MSHIPPLLAPLFPALSHPKPSHIIICVHGLICIYVLWLMSASDLPFYSVGICSLWEAFLPRWLIIRLLCCCHLSDTTAAPSQVWLHKRSPTQLPYVSSQSSEFPQKCCCRNHACGYPPLQAARQLDIQTNFSALWIPNPLLPWACPLALDSSCFCPSYSRSLQPKTHLQSRNST